MCDVNIHDELKNMEESSCPFCDQPLVINKVIEPCCSEQDVENVNGINVCINCGLVHSCDYVTEYVNLYDNMYRILKKLVYHRKYHIANVLDGISYGNNIQLTYHQREQIHKVFVEINSVIHEVNDGRKRMMSIKYIIKQLFKMLGLPYKDINVTKCKKTLKYYEQRWEKIESLIGDRIQWIITA